MSARPIGDAVHPLVHETFELADSDDRSQAAIARRAGYGLSAISHWRAGRRTMPLAALTDVLEVLGFALEITPLAEAPGCVRCAARRAPARRQARAAGVPRADHKAGPAVHDLGLGEERG